MGNNSRNYACQDDRNLDYSSRTLILNIFGIDKVSQHYESGQVFLVYQGIGTEESKMKYTKLACSLILFLFVIRAFNF